MAVAPTRTDADLVRGLQARDRAAWEALYGEYQPRLRAFAYRLAGNVHDADDLVQETFVRALPALDRLDPDQVDLGGYLFATTKNLFLKHVERGKRAEPTAEVPEPDVPAPIEDDPERSALLRRQQHEVRVANARLDPRQRLVLALCELEERSYAEIGELVGLNDNAVAQLVFRARERLRTELRLAQVDPESLPEECRAFLPSLAQHLDGRLRGPKLEATLAHLESCERCQAALADMREAKRRYRALLLPPLGVSSEEARAAIDHELERGGYWRAGSGRAGLRRPRGAAALRAAAVVTLLAVGGGLGAAKLLADTEPSSPLAATAPPATTSAPQPVGTRPAAPPQQATTSAPKPTPKPKKPQAPTPTRKPKPKPTPQASAPPGTTTAAVAPPPPTESSPRKTTPASKPRVASPPRRRPAPVPPAPPAQTTAPTVSAGDPPPTTVDVETTPPPDTTPPTVTFSSSPEPETTSRTATFSFAASEPGSTFACSYDGDPFVACESPATIEDAGLDEHSFAVRATGAAGNTGPAAVARWTVVAPLPDLVASLTNTSVTVKNVGAGAAGVSIVDVSGVGTFTIPALAPGASATRTYACTSGTIAATADETRLVAESDETNNTATRAVTCLGFGT